MSQSLAGGPYSRTNPYIGCPIHDAASSRHEWAFERSSNRYATASRPFFSTGLSRRWPTSDPSSTPGAPSSTLVRTASDSREQSSVQVPDRSAGRHQNGSENTAVSLARVPGLPERITYRQAFRGAKKTLFRVMRFQCRFARIHTIGKRALDQLAETRV